MDKRDAYPKVLASAIFDESSSTGTVDKGDSGGLYAVRCEKILFLPDKIVMEDLMLPEAAQRWAELLLIWVGFGTLAGLLAKAIMPGRDPGGAVATLAMGIGGTVIGCGTLTFFSEAGTRISPISPLGFVVATGGAFILLVFYRLLAGYWFVEGDRSSVPRPRSRSYGRRRRRDVAHFE